MLHFAFLTNGLHVLWIPLILSSSQSKNCGFFLILYYTAATNLAKILFYAQIISILLETPRDFLNNYYPRNS